MNLPARIVVSGAGRMGRGLAQMFAYAGIPVTVVDMKPRSHEEFEVLRRAALAEIGSNLDFLSRLDLIAAAQVDQVIGLIEIRPSAEVPEVLKSAEMIIEGVPETREAKAEALGQIGSIAPVDTIVASTTSTMLVTELQDLIQNPQRFLNTHFLNPAYLIPLVEVSPGPVTDEAVTGTIMELFRSMGKVPVRCAPSPGYIIPRLQALIMSEACRMVDEGVASPEEIDKAITHGFGPRFTTMGVLEFIDWGGVDILYYAGNYLAKALNSPRHAPPPQVTAMMETGHTGMREGQGYYDFRGVDMEAYRQEKLARFVTLLRNIDQLPEMGICKAGRK